MGGKGVGVTERGEGELRGRRGARGREWSGSEGEGWKEVE